ncbi:hypothetical protein [Streptomyces sp. NPDC050560]|uniref:hypothetical protein n=1 Tax=Streptomyces sp. NPDC050560 TaxID=3365630 RepID=UPI00379CEC97
MKSTLTDDDAPLELSGAGQTRRPSPGDLAWRAFLAVLVMAFGWFVGVVGPLFAIACTSCQDGVRDPRFYGALTTLAWYVVPLTVVGTVVGLFLPRAGARAGWTGTGVLFVLLIAIVALGQAPA